MARLERNGGDLGIVQCKQSRHVYSAEGDSKKRVKVQKKRIKRDLSTKKNIEAETEAESKMRNTWR